MPTPNLGLNEPVIGSQNWGGTMNQNLSIIDTACGLLGPSGPGNPTLGNVLIGNGSAFVSGVLASSNLSNGVTGTGAVVLAASPTLTGTVGLSIVTMTGAITVYNGIATVGKGVPAEYAITDLTGQHASISSAVLYTTTTQGFYRIVWEARVSLTDSGSPPASTLGGSTGFQIGFTAPDSTSVTTPAWWGGGNNGSAPTSASGNTASTWVGGIVNVYAKAASNITYNFGYTGTNMQYSLHIRLEAL